MKPTSGWISKLRDAAARTRREPLAWIALGLFLAYLAWSAAQPAGVFWSVDEGGKLIYLQNVLRTGDARAPLDYLARSIDPQLQYVPFVYWVHQGDQVYTWWPVAFSLISLPFYSFFGWLGLYILPALCGALSALLAGLIARRLAPSPRWAAPAVALITGLATPVLVYSTLFWEHTPSLALFLAAFWLILRAVDDGQTRGIVLAGVLASLAIWLRTEVGVFFLGMGLALLLLKKWKLLLRLAAGVAPVTLAWLFVNWFIMGNPISRQIETLTSYDNFLVLNQMGLKFLGTILYNAPASNAFSLSNNWLLLGSGLALLALAAPFLGRLRWLGLAGYAGTAFICAWGLFSPEGYKLVSGLVLVAPFVLFSTWGAAGRDSWRSSRFALLAVLSSLLFAAVYVARAWAQAGGLQWGPRYLLVIFPLAVIAGVTGLARALPGLSAVFRRAVLGLALVSLLLGAGFEVRGLTTIHVMKQYYQQSEQALLNLDPLPIVTNWCFFANIVPDLYWQRPMVNIAAGQIDDWKAHARQVGLKSFYVASVDLCAATPLAKLRAAASTSFRSAPAL